MNKSLISNGIAALVFVAGLFALSDGITNWLVVWGCAFGGLIGLQVTVPGA